MTCSARRRGTQHGVATEQARVLHAQTAPRRPEPNTGRQHSYWTGFGSAESTGQPSTSPGECSQLPWDGPSLPVTAGPLTQGDGV